MLYVYKSLVNWPKELSTEIENDQIMKPEKYENWLFVLSIGYISVIVIAEIFFPHGIVGTVAYLLVIFYFLFFPNKKHHVLGISIITSIYLIIGYLFANEYTIITNAITFNRIITIAVVWLGLFFTLRYKKFLNAQLQQKKHLNAVFENATEGMLISNVNGDIIAINQFAEKMFGYQHNELLGVKVEQLIPKRFAQRHQSHRENFVSSPHTRPMGAGRDLFGLHSDGTEFPVEVSLSHFKTDNELFVVAFIVDITERKKASENLRREKEIAQMYLDIAPVIFMVLNTSDEIQLINKYGSEILGYKESEIVGKNWIQNFIPVDDQVLSREVFANFLRGQNQAFEVPVVGRNGSLKIISWKGSVILNEANDPQALLCSGEDVTEKRAQEEMNLQNVENIKKLNEELEYRVEKRTLELAQALDRLENVNKDLNNQITERKVIEEKLLSSQRLYKAIAHNFPDGIIGVLNNEFRYILVDGKELHSLGLSVNRLFGKKIFEELQPESGEDFEQQLQATFEGAPSSFEVYIKDKIYNVVAVPLPDVRDEINEILVVMQNVTSQKTMEEGLRKSLEKERELGELKSRFVTMASHEFRTPLSTILSSVFLLENYTGDTYEKQKTLHINRIKKSVNNLTEILNDFLSIGKLEEGRVEVHVAPLNLVEFIRDFIHEMESVKKNDQRIEYRHLKGDSIVHSDKQLLKNIMINLVSNAIKYSNPGDIINITSTLNHQTFEIQVEDQGIGIPENEQEQIFKRFYRANNATNIQGTGLGLNIVSKYVELLDGSIEFESKQNKGTTFKVKLPVKSE